MERDTEADKLALVVSFAVLPLAMAVLGSFMWPMFNSAGDSVHQSYRISEILIGFVGGGVLGEIVGGVLMYVRSRTEEPVENGHH